MSARANPRLTFACELPSARLAALLADGAVLGSLNRLGARVALALEELSDERAAAVRRRGEAGVPVVAWLLLPREEGYYFTLDNASAAGRRYEEVREWGGEHGLRWDAITFDLEPALDDMRRAFEPGARGELARAALARARDAERLRRGSEAYSELIGRIHGDGLAVEVFAFPFLLDDRRAGSSVIHRVMSAPQVQPDCEFSMLYTSFIGPLGPAVLESYGADAQAIAVGSTGGGIDAQGDGAHMALARTLGWSELARDLRIARRFSDEIAIFSLEGCVEQGMLERLESLDWDMRDPIPGSALATVAAARAAIRAALGLASHPRLALAAVALALVMRRRGADERAGERDRFPLEWLRRTAFRSYVLPGVILAGAVGGSAALAAAAVLVDGTAGALVSLAAAAILAGYVAVEIRILDQPRQWTPTEALLPGGRRRPELVDNAHRLVTDDPALLDRILLPPDVNIRAADRGQGHLHDRVGRAAGRHRPLFQHDSLAALEHRCSHRLTHPRSSCGCADRSSDGSSEEPAATPRPACGSRSGYYRHTRKGW